MYFFYVLELFDLSAANVKGLMVEVFEVVACKLNEKMLMKTQKRNNKSKAKKNLNQPHDLSLQNQHTYVNINSLFVEHV